MKFEIDLNPYDDRKMFKKTSLELQEGETYCFVGCNGSGKSTLMDYIVQQLEHKHAYQIRGSYMDFRGAFGKDKYSDTLAYYSFDKGSHEYGSEMDFFLGHAGVAFSSTGEGIAQKLGSGLTLLGKFIHDDKNKGKNLWILFDDCDAGTSIDMINDIKEVVELIRKDCEKYGITLTFILSANSYEMCKDYHCINVWDYSTVSFTSYEEYKEFVLKSRKRKDKQYEQERK